MATPSDFGRAGAQPTHPQLLDWLAAEFVNSGWSSKHIHRLIVGSRTYRQAAHDRPAAWQADADNLLLRRFSPRRLDAEAIRDAALAVAGLLNRQLAGPSVFPPLPPGRPQPVGGWQVSQRRADQARRSLYVFVRRNDRYPLLEVFDYPDTHESCASRNTTITAPQALTLLNSPLTHRWAQEFAQRLLDQAGTEAHQQVTLAYELAYSRQPGGRELRQAVEFLEQHALLIAAESPLRDKETSSADKHSSPAARRGALADFCAMLLNSNEFVFRF